MKKIPIITCPELSSFKKIKHGFFTRNGGVSKGIYSSLNVGFGSDDTKKNVEKNRKIALQTLGTKGKLYTLYQVHSNKVVVFSDDFDDKTKADALVTDKPGIVLGILTADCTPILFADPNAKIIGAAHAGWKGAHSGILENTVEAMKRLGAKNISAAIGPTIGQASYEVGPEFYKRLVDDDKNNAEFFLDSIKAKHYMFDLPDYVTSRLAELGLKSITNVHRDTCGEEREFFSYRRSCLKDEGDYGRNLSAIVIA